MAGGLKILRGQMDDTGYQQPPGQQHHNLMNHLVECEYTLSIDMMCNEENHKFATDKLERLCSLINAASGDHAVEVG